MRAGLRAMISRQPRKHAAAGECYLCGKAPHMCGVKMCPKCPEGNRKAVQALNDQRTANPPADK